MNYEKWLETEKAYGEQITKKMRKKYALWMILAIPIVMLVLCGIGMLTGGMEGAVSNIKYGLICLVFVEFLILIGMLPNPGKRLIKILDKEVSKELPTNEQREEFASQMLGAGGQGSVRSFSAIDSTKREERVFVTKDYLYFSPSSAFACIVRLKDVERVELDASDVSNYIKAGNTTVRVNSTLYPIYFYYHKPEAMNTKKKVSCDKAVTLDYRNMRDQVVQAMQELSGEEEENRA